MINMLAQVLKEDSRVHSLYEERCGQDQQLSPVNCSGSRKCFKDSEMELIRGSAKIEELASWVEERRHVLHEVVEVQYHLQQLMVHKARPEQPGGSQGHLADC